MGVKKVKQLKEEKAELIRELEELHIYEPSAKVYKQKRYELESQIYHLENLISDEEYFVKMNKILIKATVVAIAIGLLIMFIV